MNIPLNTYQILEVSGKDAQEFLQGQLSNDIDKLQDNQAQINAYCQHQGKIIALITVMKRVNLFYLLLPKDLIQLVTTRLNMFIIMSDVKITNSELSPIGVIGGDGSYKINNKLAINLIKDHQFTACNEWEILCIAHKLPEIFTITSEKFVPQMLNLDINELGVNFFKGCYTGQEVVARLHYLGKAKRRLFKFKSDFLVKVGDELQVQNSQSQKSSGIVVRVVKLSNFHLFLATLEVDKTTSKITINNKQITFNE